MKSNTQKSTQIIISDSPVSFKEASISLLIDQLTYAIQEPLTSEEKGKIYTDTLLAYLSIKNDLDQAYLETIESGLHSLGQLIESEKKQNDLIEEDIIRKKLQEIDDLD